MNGCSVDYEMFTVGYDSKFSCTSSLLCNDRDIMLKYI